MMPLIRSRWTWICLGIVLLGAGGWVWSERQAILAWHWSSCLAEASEADRAAWIEKLRTLDRPKVIAALLRQVDRGSPQARANALVALAILCSAEQEPGWTVYLTRIAAQDFERRSAASRGAILTILAEAVSRNSQPSKRLQLPVSWIETAGQLIMQVQPDAEPETLLGAVQLAWVLMQQEQPGHDLLGPPFVKACRALATSGLKHEAVALRRASVRLASLPELGLLEEVAALVVGSQRDPDAVVRDLALAAVAPYEDVAETEALLPLLHDPDPEVRATCEHALRSRGLTPSQVRLARQMTDPQPTVRAGVPAQITDFPELDVGLWLERLSRDPSPAVRAAVIRSAAEQGSPQLMARVANLAENDPSPTVRQIASYYLPKPAGTASR